MPGLIHALDMPDKADPAAFALFPEIVDRIADAAREVEEDAGHIGVGHLVPGADHRPPGRRDPVQQPFFPGADHNPARRLRQPDSAQVEQMGLRLGNDVIQDHPAVGRRQDIVNPLEHFAPERVQERSGETGKDNFDHARLSGRAPGRADRGPEALPAFDHPGGRQPVQRLVHGLDVDPELPGQLRRGRQHLRIIAGVDAPFQFRNDILLAGRVHGPTSVIVFHIFNNTIY